MEKLVMLKRRRFLTGLTAVAGSYVLAACGGGSSSSGASDGAAVADAVNNRAVKQASPNNTAIPPATSIVDSTGATWTVRSGVVYKGGSTAGFTQSVTLLLFYGSKIYQQNVVGNWWVWSGGTWNASADPRPATAPAAVSATHFYGVNEHYVQGGLYSSVSLATQATILADLGIRVSRQDAYTAQDINTIANTVIPGLAPVVVQPCFIFYPWNDPSINGGTPTETSAYNYAYALAATAATALAGKIPVVEFGNEYDIDPNSGSISSDGESITDYNNSTFPIFRGALRGSINGWRSVDTTGKTKIIANASAGWLHFGFLDGLMTGTQPNGSTGHPKITPDIIQWHWYSDMGDIQNATGGSGTYNILSRLQSSYGLPIMITEIGARPTLSAAQAQAYITSTAAELATAATKYNLIGMMWYELYDDVSGTYGLLTSNQAKKPLYSTMKSAIAANPKT
jgi:hypothetical protein